MTGWAQINRDCAHAVTSRLPLVLAVMGIITAALLFMISGQVSTSRIFGVGITVAVLVDATVVRMVLVPACMRLFGTAAWWAPRPLARLHERSGLTETRRPATPVLAAAAQPVG